MADRKEISIAELQALKKKQGPTGIMADIEVEGIVTIFDKDGNVKSKMKITSLELPEE
jgi:hypothetical protein